MYMYFSFTRLGVNTHTLEYHKTHHVLEAFSFCYMIHRSNLQNNSDHLISQVSCFMLLEGSSSREKAPVVCMERR